MTALIDANIVLDVLMDRAEFYADSSKIWKLCEVGQIDGYISTLTFANIVYIMRRQLDPDKISNLIRMLNLIFEFADFTASDMIRAAELNWNDFEDAIQSVIAKRIGADYIITRNVRDFTKSEIMAFTPAELLARI